MIGALVVVIIAIVVAAIAVWRVGLTRRYAAKPDPRHARAYGEPRSFKVD